MRPAFRSIAILSLLLVPCLLVAAAPRALPEGKQPPDARLQPPKDLNGYFPFTVPKSKEEWAPRADAVRRQIALSQGIWPAPEKTPLNAVVHGKIDRGDYTVEKVFFESYPGFFVTGNLYRPKEVKGKAPGVLFAHGHWNDGRFIDIGRLAVRKEIVIGSERFEEGGRSLLQALPVQVARMGCVCFHYDMIGYADSQQLSFELGHRFAKQRPAMNAAEGWGLFSPQAESHLQSIMGLQTWNSVRALDFLLSLPEIDSTRIGITGASGGGTQTMLLAGIDSRITVSYPAVMVSTAMQGGCTCENSSLLRIETGNIEFAALFAPKPQGMTAANDWTKELSTKGFPDLKAHYALLGAPKNIEMANNVHFNHNYNYVNRSTFYAFLNKQFKLGLEEPVVEEDYQRLTREEMSVWDSAHPQPPSGDDYERRLCSQLAEASARQLAALEPKDTESLARWREVVGGAASTLVGRTLPAAKDVEFEKTEETSNDQYSLTSGVLKNQPRGEAVPVVFLHPKTWNGRVVIWLSEAGKAGLFGEDGAPSADANRLIEAGVSVVGVDLIGQGEFNTAEQGAAKNRPVRNPREFAGYTYGYNHPLVIQRAHDVLSVVSFVKNHEHAPQSVEIVALDTTAPIAALALTQCASAVKRAALDTRGFRFHTVNDYLDANFLPGGAKYADLPGFLSLAAPANLWLAGETTTSSELVKKAYSAAGPTKDLTLAAEKTDAKAAALDYLTTK